MKGRTARGLGLLTLIAALAAIAMTVTVAPAVASSGCTPGYWKNHITSSQTVGGAFGSSYEGAIPWYQGDLLTTALSYGGGPGDQGAARILLRAAAAAWFNAGAGLGDWAGYSQATLATLIADTINDGTRDDMLALASQLDYWNNEGCPLN